MNIEPNLSTVITDNDAKLNWLCRLRWVAAAGQLVVMPIGYSQGFISQENLPWLLLFNLVLLLINATISKQLTQKSTYPSWIVLSHLCMDFLFFILLISLSSGFANPLINLMFLHFALAGLTVKRSLGLFFYIWGVALISLVYLTSFNFPSSLRSFMYLLSYLMIGLTILVITGWYARSVNEYKEALFKLRLQLGKVDNLRASGLLAANLCHELATPLNEAVIHVDSIRHSATENERDHLCELVEDKLLHCGTRLRRVFSDTSMDASQDFISTDLVNLIRGTLDSWQADLQKTVRVEFQCLRESVIRELPRLLFIRTFLDFLDNAYAAIPEKNGHILVELKNNEKDSCEIAVSDNGAGFDSDIKQRIGTPFLTTKSDGVGLGLYTASHLALHLGGQLSIGVSQMGGARISLDF